MEMFFIKRELENNKKYLRYDGKEKGPMWVRNVEMATSYTHEAGELLLKDLNRPFENFLVSTRNV